MKWLLYFCLLLTGTVANASQKLLIDPYYSPFTGSADLDSIQNFLVLGEDAWLQDYTGRNAWGRTFEQLFVWYNVGSLLAVTQHEVFGHGYRLRELGITPARYRITPWGGATYFEVNDSFKVGKFLATVAAGIEADGIMARYIKMEWMREGVIDGRLALTYTQAQQSPFWYTMVTNLGKVDTNGPSGNDVSSYIYYLNASYPKNKISLGTLTRLSIFNLIDPMTFYAYYAFFYYIAEGKAMKFPMVTLAPEVKYLPNIRVAYAPYAPEVYLENFLTINNEPLYFYLKGGRRSFGAGAAYDNVWSNSRVAIGLRVDFWNQNNFISSATLYDLKETGTAFRPTLDERTWGGALSLTETINLSSRFALYTELGGKTSGYLPGYSLSKEVIARIGCVFE